MKDLWLKSCQKWNPPQKNSLMNDWFPCFHIQDSWLESPFQNFVWALWSRFHIAGNGNHIKALLLHFWILNNFLYIITHSVWIKVNYWFWYSKLYNQFSDIKLKTFYLTCIKTNFTKPFYVRLIRNSVVLLTHLKYKFILDRYS